MISPLNCISDRYCLTACAHSPGKVRSVFTDLHTRIASTQAACSQRMAAEIIIFWLLSSSSTELTYSFVTTCRTRCAPLHPKGKICYLQSTWLAYITRQDNSWSVICTVHRYGTWVLIHHHESATSWPLYCQPINIESFLSISYIFHPNLAPSFEI